MRRCLPRGTKADANRERLVAPQGREDHGQDCRNHVEHTVLRHNLGKRSKSINAKEEKTRKHARQLWQQSSLTQQTFAEETLRQGRSPIRRYCPHRKVFPISSSFDFVTKSLGKRGEDDAAAVDYVAEQLDVDRRRDPHRNRYQRGNALGTVTQLRRTSVPFLTLQARLCTA